MKNTMGLFLCCIPLGLMLTEVFSLPCPHGKVNYNDGQNCYWITDKLLSSSESNTLCQKNGGILGNLVNKEALDILSTQMNLDIHSDTWFTGIWLGLSDEEQEGVYKTVDGVNQTWLRWKTGEPDDVNHTYNCVKMFPSDPMEPYTYDDRDCSESGNALCYIHPGIEQSTTATSYNITPSYSVTDLLTSSTSTGDTVSISNISFTLSESISFAENTYDISSTISIVSTVRISNLTDTISPSSSVMTYLSSLEGSGYSSIQTNGMMTSEASITMTTQMDNDIESTSTQMTTTSSNSTDKESNKSACWCLCNKVDISDEILQEKIKQMIGILTIPKKSTSASKRKLISASDDRISARNLGYFGAAILVIVVGFIVFLDLTSVYDQVELFKRYHSHVGHRNAFCAIDRPSRKFKHASRK